VSVRGQQVGPGVDPTPAGAVLTPARDTVTVVLAVALLSSILAAGVLGWLILQAIDRISRDVADDRRKK
jgi:hypothetical protein